MSLNDYLAKHYGSSDKKRKGKKSERRQGSASAYGMNMVITDDDDRVHELSVPLDRGSQSKLPEKPRFKEAASSWRAVQPAKPAPLDELLVDDEERPVIAEGSELVEEYHAEKQRKKVEEKMRRREQQQQQRRRQQEQLLESKTTTTDDRAGSAAAKDRSPSPVARRYGLQTAEAVKEDSDRARERYMRKLRETSSEISGRGAKTVYRDPKTGKVIDIEQVEREKQEKTQRHEQLRQMHTEWNKGLVQQRQRHEEQQMIENVRQSGSVDFDSQREAEQRARQHWNDPALKFLQAKKSEKTVYPEYKGYAPPNRFNIRPGYRWDGVDRSNGFEQEMFKNQASASAQRAEAYSYSVADM
ncbi:Pre-mRNA-splicing factor cwc26 [Coemansia sp. RSA 2708]|nr:Pre-mRNA-splicing factor cwc26 [Coemansia sp. RSA 2708]